MSKHIHKNKYRAWHKTKKKFAPKECNITIQGDDAGVCFDVFNGNFDNECLPLKDVVLSQRTGFMDDNATAIYEGDIISVSFNNAEEMLFAIVYELGAFYGVSPQCDGKTCMYQKELLSDIMDMAFDSVVVDDFGERKDIAYPNIQVVDTIYESPNFLEI